MSPQQQLLTEIDAFLARHPMTPTQFGVNAINDGKLVGRLRRNENITTRTIERARKYMAKRERKAAKAAAASHSVAA